MWGAPATHSAAGARVSFLLLGRSLPVRGFSPAFFAGAFFAGAFFAGAFFAAFLVFFFGFGTGLSLIGSPLNITGTGM